MRSPAEAVVVRVVVVIIGARRDRGANCRALSAVGLFRVRSKELNICHQMSLVPEHCLHVRIHTARDVPAYVR